MRLLRTTDAQTRMASFYEKGEEEEECGQLMPVDAVGVKLHNIAAGDGDLDARKGWVGWLGDGLSSSHLYGAFAAEEGHHRGLSCGF